MGVWRTERPKRKIFASEVGGEATVVENGAKWFFETDRSQFDGGQLALAVGHGKEGMGRYNEASPEVSVILYDGGLQLGTFRYARSLHQAFVPVA